MWDSVRRKTRGEIPETMWLASPNSCFEYPRGCNALVIRPLVYANFVLLGTWIELDNGRENGRKNRFRLGKAPTRLWHHQSSRRSVLLICFSFLLCILLRWVWVWFWCFLFLSRELTGVRSVRLFGLDGWRRQQWLTLGWSCVFLRFGLCHLILLLCLFLHFVQPNLNRYLVISCVCFSFFFLFLFCGRVCVLLSILVNFCARCDLHALLGIFTPALVSSLSFVGITAWKYAYA